MKHLTLEAHSATVTNINPRPELHGDETKVAVDVDVAYTADAGLLKTLSRGGASGEAFDWSFLWDDGDVVRDLGLRDLPFDRKYEDQSVTFEITALEARRDFHGCVLRKFKASPERGGMVDVKFQVQVPPDAADVAWLTDLLTHKADVSVLVDPPAQGDFIEDQERETEGEAA